MKNKIKLKRLLSFILTVCLLFGMTVSIRPSNLTAEVTAATIDNVTSSATYPVSAGTITYTVTDNAAKITGFTHIDTSVTTVDIPSTLGGYPVTNIGDYAFNGCSSLTSITIPSSVTSIGNRAFFNCSGLTSVTIPSSVTSIGERAFYNCKSLINITIPEGVTNIGLHAFENCLGLTSVTIPSSVTNIGNNPFYICRNLSSISVEPGNTNFSSLGGVLFDKNETTLISYPCAKSGESYTVPFTVTKIGVRSFPYCTYLKSVTIPEGVKNIGLETFKGCLLISVEIPSSVTSIGTNPFQACSKLSSISVDTKILIFLHQKMGFCLIKLKQP